VIFYLPLLQNLVFWLSFSFCNLIFLFCLCNCFGILSSLQFLQLGICVQFLQKNFGVIFCLPLLQNLLFQLSFSFCNLVFLFCLCNCFGISSSLQFLQFGICVQFLQFFFSDILSSTSAKSSNSTFLQLLPWHLLPKRLFGYVGYLLIWEFSFLILFLCIVTTRVLFRLLTTRFFMSELSTLRSIVILLVIISSMAPLLCLLFLLPCRL